MTFGRDVSLELVLTVQERVCLVPNEVCFSNFFPSWGEASEWTTMEPASRLWPVIIISHSFNKYLSTCSMPDPMLGAGNPAMHKENPCLRGACILEDSNISKESGNRLTPRSEALLSPGFSLIIRQGLALFPPLLRCFTFPKTFPFNGGRGNQSKTIVEFGSRKYDTLFNAL